MNTYRKIIDGRLRIPNCISEDAKNLLKKLLTKNAVRRLGCKDDGESIMIHKFFKELNFDAILSK